MSERIDHNQVMRLLAAATFGEWGKSDYDAMKGHIESLAAENRDLRKRVEAAERYRERVRNHLSNAEWNVQTGGATAWFPRDAYNKLMATDPFNRSTSDEGGE